MYRLFAIRQCPFVQRVLIGLKVRNVATELIKTEYIDLESPPREILHVNPEWTVPTLIREDGKGIDDSLNILDFIDTLPSSGPLLFGAEPFEKAHARFVRRLAVEKVLWPLRKAIFHFGNQLHAKRHDAQIQEACTALSHLLTQEAKQGPFFGGENLSGVDAVLAPFLWQYHAVRQMDQDIRTPPPQSRGARYMDALFAHPYVKSTVLPLSDTAAEMEVWHCMPESFEAITQASALPMQNPELALQHLNLELPVPAHPTVSLMDGQWHLSGLPENSLNATFLFEHPTQALRCLRLIASLEETVGHRAHKRLEDFSALQIRLGRPSAAQRDFAFARILTEFLFAETGQAYGEWATSSFS